MLFDSHCHLDDPRLLPLIDTALAEAESAGVAGFLIPGVHPEGWDGIAALAHAFPQIAPSFGVHPMHADLVTPELLSKLRLRCDSAAAIGEIGLDYSLPASNREVQKKAFRAQLAVAVEAGNPVLIHCRKAFNDLLTILAEERVERVGGAMHAFSGSPEIARECLRLGLHISLAGTVTYTNAVRPVAVAASVPLERLLLETDAPDLAPEPHRSGVNLPAYLADTARRVAAIRGMEFEEIGRVTAANAARLFRLDHNLRWKPERVDLR